jgi:GTP-binding protein HflX
VLVGLALPGSPRSDVEEHLEELSRLAETAGAEVLERMLQERAKISPATFVGRGKVEELKEAVRSRDANLIIFDDDLSPAQARNVEKEVDANVIDRTELILDIFARHARTRQAMLQVELAQLQYAFPRLRRMWDHLSRQDGGIGTRGPGETQLEVDRRRIRDRMSRLKKELRDVERVVSTQRKSRSGAFSVVLVGYTNAGKSTLMNRISRAEVLVQDRLFATLDSITRRVEGKSKLEFLLTDTVGFIRKLPHHLVESFRATLMDVGAADLLLHVVDASHPDHREQMIAVDEVLDEIGARDIPTLTVFNKADLCGDDLETLERVNDRRHPGSVTVSARLGDGLDRLLRRIEAHVEKENPLVEIEVPWEDDGVVSRVYRDTTVLDTLRSEDGTLRVLVRARARDLGWIGKHPRVRVRPYPPTAG